MSMSNAAAAYPSGVVYSSHVSTTSGSLLPRPQATPFVPGLSVGNPFGISPFIGAGCPSTPAACFNSPLTADPAISGMELGPLPQLQVGMSSGSCGGAPLVTDPFSDPRITNKQLALQALANGGQLIMCRLFVGGLPNNVCSSHIFLCTVYLILKIFAS